MKRNPKSGSLTINKSVEGKSIEQKFRLIMENKEPIEAEAPMIYTERNEGVQAGYNIRTDRFDIALDGIDKIQASKEAKRAELAKMEVVKDEPTQGNEKAQ